MPHFVTLDFSKQGKKKWKEAVKHVVLVLGLGDFEEDMSSELGQTQCRMSYPVCLEKGRAEGSRNLHPLTDLNIIRYCLWKYPLYLGAVQVLALCLLAPLCKH